MTQAQRSELDQAILRAQRRGITIVATGTRKNDGARVFLTTSGSARQGQSGGHCTHWVVLSGTRLTCDCPARVICCHRAVVHARLASEYAWIAAPAPATRATTVSMTASTVGPDHAAPARSNAPFSIWK